MREGRLPKRQYTEEFKVEAVRLASSAGGHESARRLGIPVATLGNWSRRRRSTLVNADGLALPGETLARRPISELEAENFSSGCAVR